MIVFVGALLGLLSVVVGALSDHAFKDLFTEEQARSLTTAIRYNQLYAVMIVSLGLVSRHIIKKDKAVHLLNISLWLFIAGTSLFCSGIYLSLPTGLRYLIFLTPLGGIIIMLAWLALALFAFKFRNSLR